MKKFKASDIIKPTVVLLIICLVASFLLAMTNKVTAPRIEELAKQTELKTRQEVLPAAAEFEEIKQGDVDYCIGKNAQGSPVGFVFITVTKGYGGDVKVMTGVTNEGKVAGIQILALSETAGLGMRAKEESFLKQFVDKVGGIGVAKNNPGENEIQALTGATITSKAVTSAVNEALTLYETVKGGANNG